jgi:hypothetical protein
MKWHIFCHVIDNLGDAGVCWRLASLLARDASDDITLYIDQPQVLDALAPINSRPQNITVKPWSTGENGSASFAPHEAPDVLIEAFGCHTPHQYQVIAHDLLPQPIWINLEYLSAEAYVARSHGLPSPVMSGPAKGMTQWFFYPGFTENTGGVMWADAPQTATPARNEAFIFSYETPALGAVCEALLAAGIKPIVAAGRTATFTQQHLSAEVQAQCRFVPLVPQAQFDAQLAGNALNIVRGEDSFVRAQWAARPFIWHIYPQEDSAHCAKLLAFFELYSKELQGNLRNNLWEVWQGFNDGQLEVASLQTLLANLPAYTAHAAAWRSKLVQRDDLVAQLRAFVKSKAEKS